MSWASIQSRCPVFFFKNQTLNLWKTIFVPTIELLLTNSLHKVYFTWLFLNCWNYEKLNLKLPNDVINNIWQRSSLVIHKDNNYFGLSKVYYYYFHGLIKDANHKLKRNWTLLLWITLKATLDGGQRLRVQWHRAIYWLRVINWTRGL